MRDRHHVRQEMLRYFSYVVQPHQPNSVAIEWLFERHDEAAFCAHADFYQFGSPTKLWAVGFGGFFFKHAQDAVEFKLRCG